MTANREIYQVLCTKAECGRKFGFRNQNAIRNGATGRECCGDEHEVKMIWSITSGKQRLLFDNTVIYFAKLGLSERQKGFFAFEWKSLGLDFSVYAYAAPPIRYQEGWKQYDLLINGCSFDDHMCIFQLGVDTTEDPDDPIHIPRITNSSNCEDGEKEEKKEDEMLEEDISVESVNESEKSMIDTHFEFNADFERHWPEDEILENQESVDIGVEESSFDEDDDETSVTSVLLERKDKSDELGNNGIEINPNEPPTLEALKRIQEYEVEEEVEEKTVPTSYDEIWGNVFDPFGLKSTSQSCKSSKEQNPKTKVSKSPQSVVDKQRGSLRLPFIKSRCLHSLTRPLLKPKGETFDRQPKYEEMQGNDEPIF